MNKKADNTTMFWMMAAAILVLIVLGLSIYGLVKSNNASSSGISGSIACGQPLGKGICAKECASGEQESIISTSCTNKDKPKCCIPPEEQMSDAINLLYREENKNWNKLRDGDTITLYQSKKYQFKLSVDNVADAKYCFIKLFKDAKQTPPAIGQSPLPLPPTTPPNCNSGQEIFYKSSTTFDAIDKTTKLIVVNVYKGDAANEDAGNFVKTLQVNVVVKS